MRFTRELLATCLLVTGLNGVGLAQTAGAEGAGPWVNLYEGSRVRLLTAPGARTNAAIEVQLAPGWKTYWRMPGDAGVPPQFDWQGTENAAGITVLYPAPHRIPEPAAETIGYKGGVVFPIEIAAKDRSKPIGLKLDLELGICKEICVPAQATLGLEIPAASNASPLPAQVASAIRSVPKPAAEAGKDAPVVVKTEASLAGAEPTLVIEARFPGDPAASDVFIEAPDSIYVPMTKRTQQGADGLLRFETKLTAATATDLKGKELTLTLVGASGASEARWQLP